ncbi:hypothetical protein HanPSC8_Chr02g0073241 [Helianthus annuus]|nr:hypothetical protein HanPSC8_Chr02g0073241 [Helianthus annuus]
MRMTIAKRCGSPFKPHLLGGFLAFCVVLWLHAHHLMRWWLTAVFVLNFPHKNPFPSVSKKIKPQFPPPPQKKKKNSFPGYPKN